MYLEKVDNFEQINKLYKPTKVQNILFQFQEMKDCKVVKVVLEDGEYACGTKSAQVSYTSAIKRLKLNMKARTLPHKAGLEKFF